MITRCKKEKAQAKEKAWSNRATKIQGQKSNRYDQHTETQSSYLMESLSDISEDHLVIAIMNWDVCVDLYLFSVLICYF